MENDPVQETPARMVTRVIIVADDHKLLCKLADRLEENLVKSIAGPYVDFANASRRIWDAISREIGQITAMLAIRHDYDYRSSHRRHQQLSAGLKSNQFRNHKVPINRNGKRGAR